MDLVFVNFVSSLLLINSYRSIEECLAAKGNVRRHGRNKKIKGHQKKDPLVFVIDFTGPVINL